MYETRRPQKFEAEPGTPVESQERTVFSMDVLVSYRKYTVLLVEVRVLQEEFM